MIVGWVDVVFFNFIGGEYFDLVGIEKFFECGVFCEYFFKIGVDD